MDLRIQTITNSFAPQQNSSVESVSDIDVTSDFGCRVCDSDQCAVCLEKKCNTMLLPCSHQFHADCIIQWTERQFSCPLCRSEISHFVPIKYQEVNSRHAEFEKLWEKHYLFPEKKQDSPVLKAKDPSVSFKRTQSMAKLSSLTSLPPRITHECQQCQSDLDNAFVYFAFDMRFCSTQCRLSYARQNKRGTTGDDGTTSLYVDHSQIAHYYEVRNPVKESKKKTENMV